MKKKLLVAVGAVIALGIVMTMVAGSVPFLKGGLAAAQEMNGEDSTELVSTDQESYAVIAEAAVVPVAPRGIEPVCQRHRSRGSG